MSLNIDHLFQLKYIHCETFPLYILTFSLVKYFKLAKILFYVSYTFYSCKINNTKNLINLVSFVHYLHYKNIIDKSQIVLK